MLYPTASDWAVWNVQAPLHRFFTLHWAELFDENTPDTWQVRTCNVNVLMDEIVAVADVAKQQDGYRRVLNDLAAESLACARRDPVISRFYPFVAAYLEPWQKRVPSGGEIDEIRRVAAVVKGNLVDYRERAIGLVREYLNSAASNKKADLYDATMSLAVEVSQTGYSTEHLSRVFQNSITASSGDDFLTRFDCMMQAFSGQEQRFAVTFLPEGVRRAIGRMSLPSDIEVQVGRPAQLGPGAEADFYRQGSAQDVFVTVHSTATDPVSARHRAEQRLSQLFAAMNVYGVECDFRLKVSVALVRGPENGRELVTPSESRLGHLRNTKSVHVKAARLLEILDRPEVAGTPQLQAALQYHRLSLLSTNDEARLVNLWVAVESLCRGQEGSIIDRVCSRLAPSVALGNIRKILTSLAIYVRMFWREDDAKRDALLKLFPNSDAKTLGPEDLLSVLLQPDDGTEVCELLRLLSEHPLLCYRLFRVKKGLLANAKSLGECLKQHHQNVEWQLRRIYRVRNEILHSGRTVPYLRHLIQHLRTYLLVTVQSLAYELGRQRRWTIAEALEHRCLLYDHALRVFQASPPPPVSHKTLLDIAASLGPQDAPHAWTAAT